MNMNKEKQSLIRISDLALAAALSLCAELQGLSRHDPRRAEFLFRKSDATEKFVEKYWKGELRVEPQEYFGQLRKLKARLYGGKI